MRRLMAQRRRQNPEGAVLASETSQEGIE